MTGIFAFVIWKKNKIDLPLMRSLGLIAVVQSPLFALQHRLTHPRPRLVIKQPDVTLFPPPLYYFLGFFLSGHLPIDRANQGLRQKDTGLGWGRRLDDLGFGAGVFACQHPIPVPACHYAPAAVLALRSAGFLTLDEQAHPLGIVIIFRCNY